MKKCVDPIEYGGIYGVNVANVLIMQNSYVKNLTEDEFNELKYLITQCFVRESNRTEKETGLMIKDNLEKQLQRLNYAYRYEEKIEE